MSQGVELFEDSGILTSWADHPVELVDRPEVDEREPSTPLLVRLSELVTDGVERTVDSVRRHKKGIRKLGALAAATTTAGLATGAIVFGDRHG